MEEVKEKVRPIYGELKGYQKVVPSSPMISNLDGYYACIEKLNSITKEDYSRFSLKVIFNNGNGNVYSTDNYKTKLGGLVGSLSSYFGDEEPTVNPLVSVTQTTNVQVAIVVEIATLIDKQLFGPEAKDLKPEEKTFLEKLKGQIENIKTATDFLASVIRLATECGLDLHTIAKLFGFKL